MVSCNVLSPKLLDILDAELRKQSGKYSYHLEAINFITQCETETTSATDLDDLIMKQLKPKLGGDAVNITIFLIHCFNELARYDESFKYYLQHFTGYHTYNPPPGLGDIGTDPENGSSGAEGDSNPAIRAGAQKRIRTDLNENERMEEEYVFTVENHIIVDKLFEFSILGLHLTDTEYENLTADCKNHKPRVRAIFKEWKQRAPPGSHYETPGNKIPPFTRHYLKLALELCSHNDAIVALDL